MSRIIQSRPRKVRKIKTDDTHEGENAPAEVPAEPLVHAAAATGVETAAVAEVATAVAVEVAPAAVAVEVAPSPEKSGSTESENWDALAAGRFDTVTSTREHLPETPAASIATESPAKTEEPVAEILPVVESVAPAVNDVEEPKAAQSKIEVAETSVTKSDKARAKAAALRAALKEDEEAAPAPSKAEGLNEAEGLALAQTELLAAQTEETTRRRKSSKTTADAPTLVARVLIGIGNKPYVRGDGPGLSADKGVPMEFMEIGQWRWVAPAAAKSPITLRLFKNDEIPATGEAVTVAPGQTVEISPVFPN